jgi:hypothetical protein
LDNELERYHEIDEELTKLERDLDTIAEAKDRAFGADKLALLDKEIEQTKKVLEAEEKRLEKAKEYYALDRKNILENYAVELDDDGHITNYDELI